MLQSMRLAALRILQIGHAFLAGCLARSYSLEWRGEGGMAQAAPSISEYRRTVAGQKVNGIDLMAPAKRSQHVSFNKGAAAHVSTGIASNLSTLTSAVMNCALASAAKIPPTRTSSSNVPVSTMRPFSNTRMRVALRTVDRRCAITKVEIGRAHV